MTATISDRYLETYLPETLISRLADATAKSDIWSEWLEGSLMHCDVSGFTPMSERLAELGKEGAELVAGVLNRFFDSMLRITQSWGGSCLKFGGDAMLVHFAPANDAARAAACGLEMQAAMGEFKRIEVGGQSYRLRMRIGLHTGRFLTASVGEPNSLLHYFVTGSAVNRVAEVEMEGSPGHVVVSEETAQRLQQKARLVKRPSGLWRVLSVGRQRRPSPQRIPALRAGELSKYVPGPIARLHDRHSTDFTAEHRRVSIMFINLFGISKLIDDRGASQTLSQLDQYMKTLITLLDQHGGVLLGTDAAEEGDKIIAIFGAPVSFEDEEERAARCALDLDEELNDSDTALGHRIGINGGFVFAGEIGGTHRREYTVIGDDVNLAARLMGAARTGTVLASQSIIDRSRDSFEAGRVRLLRVKGKSLPVRAAVVKGIRDPQQGGRVEPEVKIVGRDQELSAFLRVARRAARGRAGWVFVHGEPGIGKSALTGAAAAGLRAAGWRTLNAYCQPHTSGTPFAPWSFVLRALLGIDPEDRSEAEADKVDAAIARLRPDLRPFAPLVSELLGLPAKPSAFLQSLDAGVRRRRLTSTVIGILNAACLESPLFLLFEDVHWSDEPSLELLSGALGQMKGATLIAVTSRHGPPVQIGDSKPALSLQLQRLSEEDSLQLAGESTGLSEAGLESLVAKAGGNPLFIRELARTHASGSGTLPDTISDVMMARLDTLPQRERTVLRLASVVGPSFTLQELRVLARDVFSSASLSSLVDQLIGGDFLRRPPGRMPTLAFMHIMAQEVVYETLPFARRRSLHALFANHLEAKNAGRIGTVSELLLHHCERADDPKRIAVYAAMSGDNAASVFANREALGYYRRSMAALSEAGGTGVDRSLLLERMGDCLETSGSHKEAVDVFAQSLEELRHRRLGKARVVPWQIQPRLRESDLCRKAAVSCERASEYDDALSWLDRAQTALPPRPGRLRPQIFAARSVSLFRKGAYAEGVIWGRRAVEVARRRGEGEDLAYAHSMLANSYIEQGRLKRATVHLRQAIDLYSDLDAVRGIAVANNNLGSCYQLLGDMSSAHDYYRAALRAYSRLGDDADSAIAHNNVGEVLLALGRIDEAIAELEEVTQTHEAGADVAAVAGLAHVNLSRCHLARGDHKTADGDLRRGLRLLRGVGAEGLLTEAQIQLGELRLAQSRPRRAHWHGLRTLRRTQALEARILEARSERLLGSACAALGRKAQARDHFRRSIELARRLDADREETQSVIALARLADDSEEPLRPDDKKALRRTIGILRRMGATTDLLEARGIMSRLDQ